MAASPGASTLAVGSLTLDVAGPGPGSGLPLFTDADARRLDPGTDADAVIDRPVSVLPYDAQDGYGRETTPTALTTITLENEHLRATFLPGLGGRLWSLFDRDAGRELLFQPATLRHGNLALRNAWFPGGVEWNLGFTGHWPLTSEPVYAGRLATPDGTPVLRMWEFERMLGLVWRLDVMLPTGSRRLLVHPRLHNPHEHEVPVYWWSNIAVPEPDPGRVLVDAVTAQHFGYTGEMRTVEVPHRGDHDCSKPAEAPGSADYFFAVRQPRRPWIAAVDATGYGLVQASTPRLAGRKLFVWGHGKGGEHWQRWLNGVGAYAEIQAGLAPTQPHHLPLAPGETWHWTEAYGALHASPEVVDAPWERAIALARDALADSSLALGPTSLRVADARFDTLAHTAPEVLHAATGWGALEVVAGHLADDPATPFTTPPDAGWLGFLTHGETPSEDYSPVVGPRWRRRLEAARPSRPTAFFLGVARYAEGDTIEAAWAWQEAEDRPHPQTLRALAHLRRLEGEPELTAHLSVRAHELDPGHVGLAVAACADLAGAFQWARFDALVATLPPAVRELGRVQFLRCRSALARGDVAEARRLLDGPIVVPDLREGELSFDTLWRDFQRLAGTDEPLPAHYDFAQFDPATMTEEPR